MRSADQHVTEIIVRETTRWAEARGIMEREGLSALTEDQLAALARSTPIGNPLREEIAAEVRRRR